MNNIKVINIADLKVGDVFQTHSGAEFKVLNEYTTDYDSTHKKKKVKMVICLSTNLKLSISNFKNTIIFKHEEKKNR